jgi:undecaprenyl pyrophosphate phosphatase UppP
MFLIKKILSFFLCVIASLVSIIVLAIINSLTHLSLSGGQVVLYGLIAGIVLGFFTAYLLINYIVRKTRQFVLGRFENTLQRFAFTRRV